MAWYDEGLRFTCTQCGKCCGGAPGYVWVNEDEIAALARRLDMEDADFRCRYLRRVPRRGISLIEKANHDCIFFDRRRGCTVYEDRPRQCRTWPFWRSNCASSEEWDATARDCPGMNQGTLHDVSAIERSLADDGLPEE